MTTATAAVTPFDDRSRRSRLVKIGAWLVGIAVVLAVCHVIGFEVLGWFESLWETIRELPAQYIVGGLALQTVQTTLTAYAWYAILRVGYPDGGVSYRSILAAYAVGVAMNGFLPANIGTFVTLLMFVALIAGATFPGVLGAMVVQKIFFTLAGTFVYLYLFVSVSGSFELQLGGVAEHPVATLVILGGGAFLIVLLGRLFWRKLQGLWEKAKEGGAILGDLRAYLLHVALPSFGAWLAKLGVTAVFLAGYGIPVTFDSVMSVIGGNSLANTVSFTPGGVGINQAVNGIALADYTDPTTATAYSLGQQLIVTAWNVALALALVIWIFGWTGGKVLVGQSYEDAKQKVAEQRAARREAAEEREPRRGLLRFGRRGEDASDGDGD